MKLLPVCIALALVPHVHGQRLVGEPSDAPFRTGFGLEESEERVRAFGPGWEASFTARGVRFDPALGAGAERPWPLEIQLEHVGRASGPGLALRADVAPVREGDRVSFARGAGLVERYDVRTEGVAQSFLLHERPPGAGDLVVRLAARTDLVAVEATSGLALRNPDDLGVDVGAVTGIDADGVEVEGTLAWEGEALELVLPAAYVDAARFPLLVDPLISPVVDFGSDAGPIQLSPNVAYDEVSGNTLLLFEQDTAFAQESLYARVLRPDGTLTAWVGLGGGGSITQTSVDAVQSTTYGGGLFVVAWRQSPFLAGTPQLRLRSVDATTGAAPHPALVLASGNDHVEPDVWGVGTAAAAGGVTVVWRELEVGVWAQTVQANSDGSLTDVGPAGVLTPVLLRAEPPGFTFDGPVLAKSAAFDADATGYGNTLVLWTERNDGAATSDLFAQPLRAAETPLPLGAPALVTVSVDQALFPSVDGDGETFFVTYYSLLETEFVSKRVQVSTTPPHLGVFGLPISIVDPTGVSRVETRLLGAKVAFAWGASTSSRHLRTNWVETEALDAEESATGPVVVSVHLSSEHPFDGGEMRHGGVMVWRETPSLYYQRYESFEDGTVVEVAPACGNATLSRTGGALAVGNADFGLRVTYSGFALRLVNVAPGAPQLFPCGPCTLVLNPGGQILTTISSSGAFALPIPIDTGLVGYRATAQGGALGPAGQAAGGCSIAPRLHLTEVFDLTILH